MGCSIFPVEKAFMLGVEYPQTTIMREEWQITEEQAKSYKILKKCKCILRKSSPLPQECVICIY